MLIQPTQPGSNNHDHRAQVLWNDASRFTQSLGCSNCPDRAICGGLSVAASVYDCTSLCCQRPSECDAVCRNKPDEFAKRVREVEGFSLLNVPTTLPVEYPIITSVVPVIFHGHKRSLGFDGHGTVCLPLFKVVSAHSGTVLYSTPAALHQKFRLAEGTTIILTGISTDPALEKWWSLGTDRRLDVIRKLKELKVAIVSTPNYSLFTDQPRWDDLHSMKRIALVHREFVHEGLPAALHVNARTERDWSRWREYINSRPEITHIAFEFATGAGWAGRLDWHLKNLLALADSVSHPLHLIVRGGSVVLRQLTSSFEQVTFLDTSSFLKTMRRKAAVARQNGTLRWRHAPTRKDESLDLLLKKNWSLVLESCNTRSQTVHIGQKVA